MSTYTKSLTIAQYQALQTGLPKYCPNTDFTIGGQSYTTPQVVALITTILNASLAVAPAKAAYLGAIATARQAEAQEGETVKEVRQIVALIFNNAPTTLAELAISPKKSPPGYPSKRSECSVSQCPQPRWPAPTTRGPRASTRRGSRPTLIA